MPPDANAKPAGNERLSVWTKKSAASIVRRLFNYIANSYFVNPRSSSMVGFPADNCATVEDVRWVTMQVRCDQNMDTNNLNSAVRIGVTAVGRGVFAQHDFQAGEFIGDIEGKFIVDPDYASDYCIAVDDSTSLEPGPPFRFLNHSCEPNCGVFVWEGEQPPQLFVETLREIKANDELTIDYGWPAELAIPCQCRSPNCRGWIVAADEVDDIADRPIGEHDSDIACDIVQPPDVADAGADCLVESSVPDFDDRGAEDGFGREPNMDRKPQAITHDSK